MTGPTPNAHGGSGSGRTQKALLDAQRLIWTQQQEDVDLSRYAVRVIRLHKDERLCKVCRPLNGRRLSLRAGAGIEVRGVTYPGPPFHPACRCYEEVVDEVVVPRLVARDPEIRIARLADARTLLLHELVEHLEAIGRPGGTICLVEPK